MASPRALGLSLLLCTPAACQLFAPEPEAPSRPMEIPVAEASAEPRAEASAPAPADPAPDEPAITPAGEEHSRGKISKAALEAGVKPGLPAFEACYKQALAAGRNVQGSVVVSFVIAPDGSVPYAGALEEGTNLEDDKVVGCVLEEFQKLRFQPPVGGRASATYPLSFAPVD